MSISKISFFHSLQTERPFFSLNTTENRILDSVKNWCEYFWSLPFSPSYISYSGRVEQMDSSLDNLARVTYLAFWTVFGASLYVSPVRASLFLVGTLLPKIYHRNYNVNGMDLSSTQKGFEKMIEGLGADPTKKRSLLIDYYLRIKNPDAAKKIIEEEEAMVPRRHLKLPLIQYYNKNGEVNTALGLLDDEDRKNASLMGEIHVAIVSDHLKKEMVNKAKEFINSTMLREGVYEINALLLCAEYYFKKGNSTEEQKILNTISIRMKDHFPSVKATCDYLLSHQRFAEFENLLTRYYTRSGENVDNDKLIQTACYLIEVKRLESAEKLLESHPHDPTKMNFKLVDFYLEYNGLKEAIEGLQELTESEDTDVAQLLTKLKLKHEPSLYWKCAYAFVKYYLNRKSPDLAIAIFTMNKNEPDSLPLLLEIVTFYNKLNQPKEGQAIAKKSGVFLDKAYLEEVKYYLEKKNFRDAEQITKMKKAITQAIKVMGDRFGSTELDVEKAIEDLKGSMQTAPAAVAQPPQGATAVTAGV